MTAASSNITHDSIISSGAIYIARHRSSELRALPEWGREPAPIWDPISREAAGIGIRALDAPGVTADTLRRTVIYAGTAPGFSVVRSDPDSFGLLWHDQCIYSVDLVADDATEDDHPDMDTVDLPLAHKVTLRFMDTQLIKQGMPETITLYQLTTRRVWFIQQVKHDIVTLNVLHRFYTQYPVSLTSSHKHTPKVVDGAVYRRIPGVYTVDLPSAYHVSTGAKGHRLVLGSATDNEDAMVGTRFDLQTMTLTTIDPDGFETPHPVTSVESTAQDALIDSSH